MSVVTGDGRVAIQERRLDHQHVGVANVRDQSIGGLGIAHDDQLFALLRRPEYVLGIYRPAVREHDRFSFRQVLAHGPIGHSEAIEALRPKMAANPTSERKAETVGVAMPDRKAVDRKLVGVEDRARR
jgi:hypothetical protein